MCFNNQSGFVYYLMVVFFLLVPKFAGGQEFVIDYGFMFRININSDREYLFVKELRHNAGRSVFMDKGYALFDGEKNFDEKWYNKDSRIYKDFEKGFVLYIGDNLRKDTGVRDYFSDIFDWRIVPNSDTTIIGFKCQKATTNYLDHTVTVWFTSEIPIMDGPGRFTGLPGLILRTETIWGNTEILNILVLNKDYKAIKIPTRKQYITFRELYEKNKMPPLPSKN